MYSKGKLFYHVLVVVYYLIVLLLVAFGKDMLAMYAMAVGMLIEAIASLITIQTTKQG